MADVTLNGNTYEGISEVELPLTDGSGMALYHEGAGIASVKQTIVSTEDDGNNEVTVTLTDGTETKLYIQNGSKGSTGNTGATGPRGNTGEKGDPGVGVLGVEVNQDADTMARLVVALTDGTIQEFPITLPSGEDGVGVYSVEQTSGGNISGLENEITVTLTNGEESKLHIFNGQKGEDGVGILGVEQTYTSTEDGGDNVFTVCYTDGNESTFTVKNGSKGSKGDKGDKGDSIKGDTGKSAYQYAQEGGYAGTEAEFSAKLAKELPTKVSELTNDSKYITASGAPVQSVNGKTGTVVLDASSVGARPSTWTPTYTDVGAEKSGTATSAVSTHNTKTDAHNDIRLLITALTARLDALANSDDDTLDQMAEVVAYIKENRGLIEQITTGKVSVSDIVNNLTTNVSNKPLSAGQGVALKALIDAITVPTKVSQLTNDSGFITGYTETDPTVPLWAKASSKPSYTKSEVGLGNVENVKQYSASNPPPYPVTSVNGKTGVVIIDSDELGAVPDTRKVNGKALGADITLSASDVGALASASYTTKALTVTYDDGTSETVTLVVVK